MITHHKGCTRRDFLRLSATIAGMAPLALSSNAIAEAVASVKTDGAKVAIVPCLNYGAEVRPALKQAFDLLGGIGTLVKGKTVTVKLNLTGTMFSRPFGRPAGESFITEFSTALALSALLLDSGARRVRLVESTNSRTVLEKTLISAGWDVDALKALGAIEFENTRNLGLAKRYSAMKVPSGGLMFSSFQFNHSYEETDVMVSLCKLKQHIGAGVTLSMKNMFGITPNALYGNEAGDEDATEGRGVLHTGGASLPGCKFSRFEQPRDPYLRVPNIITDICGARPIHLSIIDGISSMSGGEGPWVYTGQLKLVKPGVLIVGLNPVATDAVGTAVMGFSDPRAPRGKEPFHNCENHLLAAEKAGLGTADLSKIEVCGTPIEKARCPYKPLNL